jgi:hypothetical protein
MTKTNISSEYAIEIEEKRKKALVKAMICESKCDLQGQDYWTGYAAALDMILTTSHILQDK